MCKTHLVKCRGTDGVNGVDRMTGDGIDGKSRGVRWDLEKSRDRAERGVGADIEEKWPSRRFYWKVNQSV